MESIIRNVRELSSDERRVYEAAFGHALEEDQQVVIQVVTPPGSPRQKPSDEPPGSRKKTPRRLPDWCNVYDGLTDDEIAEVEKTILTRSEMTRSFE